MATFGAIVSKSEADVKSARGRAPADYSNLQPYADYLQSVMAEGTDARGLVELGSEAGSDAVKEAFKVEKANFVKAGRVLLSPPQNVSVAWRKDGRSLAVWTDGPYTAPDRLSQYDIDKALAEQRGISVKALRELSVDELKGMRKAYRAAHNDNENGTGDDAPARVPEPAGRRNRA